MYQNQSIEIDIKNQVLSDYFLHRKNAIYLNNSGAYWPALAEFRTDISGLPLSDEGYKEIDKIIDYIDKIESDSYKIKGVTDDDTRAAQQEYRRIKAKRIFNRVLRATTQILQNEGYLDIAIGKNKPTITPISDLEAENERPSDEALPERLKEDMQ